MAMKFTILVSILVVVLIAAQADEAQGLGPITTVFNVSGIVPCSVNGSVNGPPFPSKTTISNFIVHTLVSRHPLKSLKPSLCN
ncbi:putative phylloplanin [Helianthus anomalus]